MAMKCLACPAEIDDQKSFPAAVGPQGQIIEDAMGRWKHASELALWTHVTLTAQVATGCLTVLSGHICPKHLVSELKVSDPGSPKKGN